MKLLVIVQLYTMLKPIIQRHKDQYDDYDYRDFVDAYLQAMERNKDKPQSTFNGKLKNLNC